MTEQTDAAEVEALADLIVRDTDEPMWSAIVIARHILTSDLLAAREAAARAEALREAADAWTQGGWSDVMLPKPTPPAVPVIAYSNRMGDWLRDRAASIARTDGAGS
jgi:hypothetical protein